MLELAELHLHEHRRVKHQHGMLHFGEGISQTRAAYLARCAMSSLRSKTALDRPPPHMSRMLIIQGLEGKAVASDSPAAKEWLPLVPFFVTLRMGNRNEARPTEVL